MDSPKFYEDFELKENFEEFQDAVCQKNELPEEGKALVKAAKDGTATFKSYYCEQLNIKTALEHWEPRPIFTSFSDNRESFSKPPPEIEWEIYRLYEELCLRDARNSLFWTVGHIAMMEKGVLEASVFIDNKHDDDYNEIRRILRRMGGVPPRIRGNVSQLTDCPISRAWWRCHIATKASDEFPDISPKDAHLGLHRKGIWKEFAEYLMKKLVVLAEPCMKSAIVKYLTEGKVTSGEELSSLLQAIARRNITKAFGILGAEQCYELVKEAGKEL